MVPNRKAKVSMNRVRRSLFDNNRKLASLRWEPIKRKKEDPESDKGKLYVVFMWGDLPSLWWEMGLRGLWYVESGGEAWDLEVLDDVYVLDPAQHPTDEELWGAFGDKASYALLDQYGPITVAIYSARIYQKSNEDRLSAPPGNTVFFQYADERHFHGLQVAHPPRFDSTKLACEGRQVQLLDWNAEKGELKITFPYQPELPRVQAGILQEVVEVACYGYTWQVVTTENVDKGSVHPREPNPPVPMNQEKQEYAGCVTVTYRAKSDRALRSGRVDWPESLFFRFKDDIIFRGVTNRHPKE